MKRQSALPEDTLLALLAVSRQAAHRLGRRFDEAALQGSLYSTFVLGCCRKGSNAALPGGSCAPMRSFALLGVRDGRTCLPAYLRVLALTACAD